MVYSAWAFIDKGKFWKTLITQFKIRGKTLLFFRLFTRSLKSKNMVEWMALAALVGAKLLEHSFPKKNDFENII